VFGSGKYGVVSFSRRLGRIVACLLLVAGRLLARAKSAQAAKIAATLDRRQGLFATTTNQLSRLSRQDSRLNRSPPIALPWSSFLTFSVPREILMTNCSRALYEPCLYLRQSYVCVKFYSDHPIQPSPDRLPEGPCLPLSLLIHLVQGHPRCTHVVQQLVV
jgi:hypothetical protein